jgi:hypothetical protein
MQDPDKLEHKLMGPACFCRGFIWDVIGVYRMWLASNRDTWSADFRCPDGEIFPTNSHQLVWTCMLAELVAEKARVEEAS